MLNRNRRMAGQALAALPEENITDQLSAALERLRAVTPGEVHNDDYGYVNTRNYPVRGETNSVDWASAPTNANVAFGPDGYSGYDGKFQVGNASELQRIEDAGINDILEIAWHSPEIESRPNIPKAPTRGSLADTENTPTQIAKKYQLQDKRTALEARSSWNNYLESIPDNVLLHNRPIGALSGDYSRADLYMREGFGPVGENGAQYAIKRNGQLEAVAPMGTHIEYAQHLQQRLGNTGETELSGSITSELQRRKSNRESLVPPEQLEDERRQREYEMNHNGDDYDYEDYDGGSYDDYDEMYEQQPEVRRRNAERDYERIGRVNRQESLRDTWRELEDSHTMNTIYAQGIRNRQAELAQELNGAVDNLNFVNREFPRPVPMPITSSPFNPDPPRRRNEYGNGGDARGFYNNVDELAADVRSGITYNMAEGNPANLRGFAKQRFIRPEMRGDTLVMKENYGPQDVQMLRDLQVQQALNPQSGGSGPAAYGISTPLDMVSSKVPVEWVTQDGRSRGPAAPITGAGGSERGMVLRRDNWEDDAGLHRGNTIFDYNQQGLLQKFVDEANAEPEFLFPGQNLAAAWGTSNDIPF